MGKAGRKPKAGQREPSGRLQRPTTVAMLNQIAAAEREKQQRLVANQPHRRGEMHKWAESPLGRLCLRRSLRQEYYDAGLAYAALVGCWRSAKGIPSATGRGGGGTGPGPSETDVRRWQTQMLEIERAVMRHGIEALLVLKTLVLDEAEIGLDQDETAVVALQAVAVENGTLRENPQPW